MRHGKTLLIFAGLFFSGFYLHAQRFPFVHYTPRDGLINNRVRSAYQDSKGRIYFSTFGGLSVYDGSRFTNYTMDNGLASSLVLQVIEMGDDSLWVMPNANKIHCLVHGKLKDLITTDKFCPVISQLIKCSDGYYYAIADGGLYRFENNRFKKLILKDKTGREINGYLNQGEEIDNKLFITNDAFISLNNFVAPSSLVVFDIKTGKTIISKKPPDIIFVALSPRKEILIATSKGLKMLDQDELAKGQIRFISPPPLYKAVAKLIAGHLYFDRQENLWILTGQGIVKLSPQGQVKSFTTQNGLSTNSYSSVLQDKENIMWFLNLQTGMTKLTNDDYELREFIKPGFVVSEMYADHKSDSVWFLDYVHKKLLVQYPNGSHEIHVNLPDAVRMIASEKTYYFTGNAGVFQGELSSTRNEIKLKFLESGMDSLGIGAGYTMPDNNGNLVFSNGYVNAVIQNKTFRYPLAYGADQFFITPDDHLWVVTRAKDLFVFQLDPKDTLNYFKLIKHYKDELPHLSPRSLTVDKNGNVWIGSRLDGLFCFYFDRDFRLTSWQQFTMKNGLSDDFISYLHCDPAGNIWACSPAGLDKLKIKDKNIFIENITRANNLYQNVIKTQTTKNGVAWVWSSAGIIKIEPSPTFLKNYQAKIFFTNIQAGNKNMTGSGAALGLSHTENDISFYVAAPSFIDEKQTRFSYRLKGRANEEWSEPSTNTEIHFVNLAPGRYTLYVKANFLTGIYADTETSYTFEIFPPWWQAWWFRILLLVLSATVTALLVRSYFRRKLHKQIVLLEKQQAIEKERSRIAGDMHDELGAGLSTIRFLSEKVKRNSLGDVTQQDADKIVMNSNDLVQKMNEIIWAMNEKNDTLEDLLFYTRSYAMEYCEENNLECTVDLPDPVPKLLVSGEIRRNVFLIIKESLHNIVKHAEASKVFIEFKMHDHLYASINDNGKGIVNNNKPGGGNGLLNMQKRIKLMGGTLELKNGHGLTVEFSVPLKFHL